ncbi:hypothetical protein QAD02_019902 [Eretmocerus hayati]|uniref:Uncharacterized protein n=1 Tax=Eretmocerus hayati TaxID=131215 RepID=A0ACC2PL24_9HYME|nr:hypothetical protein QAD02_019902 [Eretmocerus hayati]
MQTCFSNTMKRPRLDSLNDELPHQKAVFHSTTLKEASTIRLEISLSESIKNGYPEFNYSELLQSVQEKHKVHKLVHSETSGDKVVEEVLDISRYYQSKCKNHKRNETCDSSRFGTNNALEDDSDDQDENMPREMENGKFFIRTKSCKQKIKVALSENKFKNSNNKRKINGLQRNDTKTRKVVEKTCKASTKKVKATAK